MVAVGIFYIPAPRRRCGAHSNVLFWYWQNRY